MKKLHKAKKPDNMAPVADIIAAKFAEIINPLWAAEANAYNRGWQTRSV
ncbi:hypothetical protein CZ797_04960 [Pseudoalteromonas sp. JB197]|nr:hypothetical protein CZ797_04960 [Pseudoalteromonas sp. JB197]